MPIDNPRSILVIKFRNIGDVLLTTPVFANLRAAYPDARICALVNSGTEEILTGNPDIDRLFVYDRGVKRLSRTARLCEEFKLLSAIRSERFDTVFNLTEGDRGALAALFSGAGTRIGVESYGRGMLFKSRMFTRVIEPPAPTLHTVEHNLYYLQSVGIATPLRQVAFHFSPADAETVNAILLQQGVPAGSFFHAHLTSRWMFKTMPPATAARAVDMFSARTGQTAVFTAAPVEHELAYLRRVRDLCTTTTIDLGGQLTLKQLGALSAAATCFVGVDSAPMHMAAALDVPVLAFFGPSSAGNWGPWDNRCQTNPYTAGRGIQTSGRHVVLQSDRPCVPCHRDGCNGSKISDCLDFPEESLQLALAIFIEGLTATAAQTIPPGSK
jgi:lipopolysaccharide heptosyltransferase III